MSNIKLVRFKGGEDIISFVREVEDNIELMYPLSTYIAFNKSSRKQELFINFWLPINIVEKNIATIPKSEILLITEVKEDFREYYLNFLEDFESKEENPEISDMLDSLDAKHFKRMH